MEIEELEYWNKHGKKHHFRMRCQIILLSNEGLSVSEISKRLKKDIDTVYGWLNRYELSGIPGLQNRVGQGAKATLGNLSSAQIKTLEKEVRIEPQNLKKVCEKLSKLFKLKISKGILIDYLKKN